MRAQLLSKTVNFDAKIKDIFSWFSISAVCASLMSKNLENRPDFVIFT